MVRKEAIELIEEEKSLLCDIDIGEETKIAQAYDMAIKALKRKQQTKWIPVTERLPEEDVDVLTQYSDYSMSVDFRTASSSGWFWADKDDLPIAWMPLPEPYKEDE